MCTAVLAGGCGGSGHSSVASTVGVGGPGGSLRLDSCSDWRSATDVERRTTVEDLRKFAGGPVGSSAGIQNGPVLADDVAFKLFGRACAPFYARGFKLYKLYTRAAGMRGLLSNERSSTSSAAP